MNERHIHADLIIAWANGAKIQFRYSPKYNWNDISTPSWDTTLEYRIKPKPKVKKWRWVFKSKDDATNTLQVTRHHFQNQADFDSFGSSIIILVEKVDSTMIEVEE